MGHIYDLQILQFVQNKNHPGCREEHVSYEDIVVATRAIRDNNTHWSLPCILQLLHPQLTVVKKYKYDSIHRIIRFGRGTGAERMWQLLPRREGLSLPPPSVVERRVNLVVLPGRPDMLDEDNDAEL